MHIPNTLNLPTGILAGVFKKTVATYKYYWFLAIIEAIENDKIHIPKNELFARMIANAWYTVNYFHVSFGKSDLLATAIADIIEKEKIEIDAEKNVIVKRLLESEMPETKRTLKHFDANVPHWFLSQWFPKTEKNGIYGKSQLFENQCLYAIYKNEIIINPDWVAYLQKHTGILKAFCYWHLSLFLQVRNPNVPDIPHKIIKPAKRNSLNKQRTQFWDLVLKELGAIDCIYSGKKLTLETGYAVEHFVPYAFVSHDLIWNLIPADEAFNSKKSDKLPPLDKYFEGFFALQKIAVEIVKDKTPKNVFLEDYLPIFPHLEVEKEKFRDTLQPLITIAHNNGFSFLI